MCVSVRGCGCVNVCVGGCEVCVCQRTTCRVSSLFLLSCGFRGLNTGHQAQGTSAFPTGHLTSVNISSDPAKSLFTLAFWFS